MAKQKDIYKLAEELNLKKENVESGMKKDPKKTEEAIKKAHAFMFKGK